MQRPKSEDNQPPWSRIAGENSSAFASFLAYRDLGHGRSIEAAWVAYRSASRGVKKASSSPSGQFRANAVKYRWVDRAAAWDDHLQSERDKVAAHEAKKWERRRLDSLEANWQTAQQLREKLLAMLKWPISRTRSDDGKTIVEPAKWTFQTATLMAKMIAELEIATLNAVGRPEDMTDVEARAIVDLDVDCLAPGLATGEPPGIRLVEGN